MDAAKDKKSKYITMQVRRPLSEAEQRHIDNMDDPVAKWEADRYSILFEIAVFAKDEKHAAQLLRELLSSPKLIIERRKS